MLPPSSSDGDESDESPLDGSKPVCYIERLTKDNCDQSVRGKLFGHDDYKKDITIYAFMEWFVPIKQSGAAVVFIIFVW